MNNNKIIKKDSNNHFRVQIISREVQVIKKKNLKIKICILKII